MGSPQWIDFELFNVKVVKHKQDLYGKDAAEILFRKRSPA
jgi:hypothetical protein